MDWWTTEFSPFGLTHALAASIGSLIVAAWVVLGLKLRGTTGESKVRAFGAGAILTHQVLMQIYWLAPQNFDWKGSLPLHVCDIGAWLTPLSLLAPWRRLRIIIIFWGLGLTTQAFITPTVTGSPADMQFWFYWLSHLAIIAGAVYHLAVDRIRPTFAEAWFAVIATLGYILCIAAVNYFMNWTYAFVGPSDPASNTKTLADKLGPYPLRILWIILTGTAVFIVIWAGIRWLGGTESRTRPGR